MPMRTTAFAQLVKNFSGEFAALPLHLRNRAFNMGKPQPSCTQAAAPGAGAYE